MPFNPKKANAAPKGGLCFKGLTATGFFDLVTVLMIFAID